MTGLMTRPMTGPLKGCPAAAWLLTAGRGGHCSTLRE
ncbi:hypothetical protein EYF80_065627 [Liparis tanakae]|uniref:Uncharacterized protein n=1 Tax=Liparis tanakae TaxID=230148 RepID=A0A4Z2E6P0_9TELE|nr:hypothetical protein EYF80_065627 [Liparis tanakae]